MKKILFVAISATLLAASCQKTEIINQAGEPALVFTTGASKLTKALGTADAENEGTVNLKAQDFRVWAYANYDDPNVDGDEKNNIYDGMENLNIYYTEVTDAEQQKTLSSWAPTKEYYWPGTGKNLFFFAVSGAEYGDDLSKTQEAVDVTMNGDESTMGIAFKVSPDNPNVDLMVADVVDQNQGDKAVDLKFHHALSKVEFLFKTVQSSTMRVLVQSVEVEGLAAEGALKVSLDKQNKKEGKDNAADATQVTSTTYPVLFDWEIPENSTGTTFSDDFNTAYTEWSWGEGTDNNSKIELVNGTTVDLSSTVEGFDNTAMLLTSTPQDFATWLVIPQSISGKKVTVTYIINKRQFKSVFNLDTTNLKAWADNQYVRYTITLAPNLISFVPSVDAWDQYDANKDTDCNQDIEMEN